MPTSPLCSVCNGKLRRNHYCILCPRCNCLIRTKKECDMFEITLNLESAAVLLRCLNYGGAAISVAEEGDGTATLIEENIKLLRDQVCHQLSREVISRSASAKKLRGVGHV